MKTIFLILLCTIFLFVSTAYSFFPIRTNTYEEEQIQLNAEYNRLLKIHKKYDRMSGIIILGFATYFFSNGLQMMKRDATYEGGSLLLMLSSPLFFWGIALTF